MGIYTPWVTLTAAIFPLLYQIGIELKLQKKEVKLLT